MRQRRQSLGREAMPSDGVSIQPDTASNSLIVAASEENIQIIRDLIDALLRAESGVVGEAQIELIQLASSRADDVVDLLDDLYVDEANRDRGRDTVQVTADERLNAVIINAPPADVRAIKQLVARLDGARPATVVEIKYIPLTSANSLETVSLIENVLGGRGLGARRSSTQAIVLKYLREYAQGARRGHRRDAHRDGGERRHSRVDHPHARPSHQHRHRLRPRAGHGPDRADDPRHGRVNLRIQEHPHLQAGERRRPGHGRDPHGSVQPDPAGQPVRAQAPRDAGTRTPVVPGVELPPGVAPYAGLLGTELTAVPDERQQLFITVDSRTNSLLVSGTPIYLDLVSEVVEGLDALEANEREVFVYPLRNAVATDVAGVITSFVEAEQQKLISTLSPDQIGAAARLLEREVTIVGEEKSNTVLVSASPRYMDRVESMIRELDVDPPQVLIQVLLAEITLDSTLEWGFDTRYQAGPYGGDNLFFRGASSLASAFLPGLGLPSFSVATRRLLPAAQGASRARGASRC